MGSASFCTKCGSYLKLDEGLVHRDGEGKLLVLCKNCEEIQKTRELSLVADTGG